MNKILILAATVMVVLTSCATSKISDAPRTAELIEQSNGDFELRFSRRYWGGVVGPDGYVGYVTEGYLAVLKGDGPKFENPDVQDNPPDFHCIGNIIWERSRNYLSINLRRIVSETGKPRRTIPHPGNGVYQIVLIRKAKPDEAQWFEKWRTNNFNGNIHY